MQIDADQCSRRSTLIRVESFVMNISMELLGGLVLESVVSYLRRLYLGRRHNRYLRKVHKSLVSPAEVGRIVDQRIWEGLREVGLLGTWLLNKFRTLTL